MDIDTLKAARNILNSSEFRPNQEVMLTIDGCNFFKLPDQADEFKEFYKGTTYEERIKGLLE